MMDYISNPEAAKEYLSRYKLLYYAIGLALSIFVARLWYLQIIEGSELRAFSERNRIKEVKIVAPRGLILDREGRILVENIGAYEALILPQYTKDIENTIQAVSAVLQLDSERVIQRVRRVRRQTGRFAPVKIKENLNLDEVFRLQRLRMDHPGLEVREITLRSYPLAENGAQLFGYVSEISKQQLPLYNKTYKDFVVFEQGDLIGKSGLEEVLERDIRGKDGMTFIQVDAHGRETSSNTIDILGKEMLSQNFVPGRNVVLTIDKDIQEAAYRSFKEHDRIGAVVALKHDGEILAWLSTPSYNPNEFSKGISPDIWAKLVNDPFKPLRNKVIQDHTAPGSTFKPLVAIAALEEKLISANTVVFCPPFLRFGRRAYHDHLKAGFGNVTIYEALERSSNVFFYKLGMSLGIDKMADYIKLFGIGTKTGVELPREIPGLMPTSSWKKQAIGEEWQPGENLSNAIGQGFVLSTPIQMALAYSIIGLEGKVYQPYVIKKVTDKDGALIRESQPKLIRDLTEKQENGIRIKPETFKVVKEGMRRVANGERGTAKWWRIPGVEMAGKTGTSQVMSFSADQIFADCKSRPIQQRHHGWYIAFAPADKPEITVAVLAEHACHGSTGAAPIVRDVIQAYMEKHRPELIASGKKSKNIPVYQTIETTEGE